VDRRLPPAVAQERARAIVKWFNLRKGFGFVRIDDNNDALLHVSVLTRAGIQEVREQDQIICDIVDGQRGLQVSEVHEVIPAPPGQGGGGGGGGGSWQGGDAGEEVLGTVKFFNAAKGFGFVHPDGDGNDIFVSGHILNQAGLNSLESDQRVHIRFRQGPKGPQAVSIRLA